MLKIPVTLLCWE